MTSGAQRRPRVLVLTIAYPAPESPIAGTFVKEYVKAALPHCDVAVVHLQRAPHARPLYRIARVAVEEVPTWRVRFPRSPRPLSYLGHLAGAIGAFRLLRRAGFQPDLIHAHFFLAAVPAVLLAARRRIPVVVSEHWSVFLPDDPAELPAPIRYLAKLAFERAALVLPVSEALDRALRAHGIEARTRVLPNAVDERLFHPPAARSADTGAPKRLLAVALFYEAKGIDLLLEAVALLRGRRDDFRLDIVGDGELRPDYEALARRLGLGELVAFRGLRPKEEVAELMRRADLLVSASRFDNNPVALLEALVSGLPIVATAVGGVPEIVERDGLLAEPGPAALAAALDAALDRLGQFDRAAIAGRARERYGSERIGRALAEIYADCLARRLQPTSSSASPPRPTES